MPILSTSDVSSKFFWFIFMIS